MMVTLLARICPVIGNEMGKCGLTGVIFKPNENTTGASICCSGNCCSRSPFKGPFFCPIPKDFLPTGFDCSASYWDQQNETNLYEFDCPAISICSLLDFTFCWELFLNPQCNPELAAILFGIFGTAIFLQFLLISICFACTRKAISSICGVCRIIQRLCPRKLCRQRQHYGRRIDSSNEDPDEILGEIIPDMLKPKRRSPGPSWKPILIIAIKCHPIFRIYRALAWGMLFLGLINTAAAKKGILLDSAAIIFPFI
jgi:hypothetical protein